MKLIPMTDFVLELANQKVDKDQAVIKLAMLADKYILYAKFLKQPLKLEMFVPCDEKGNVLEDPLDVSCLKYGSCTCGEEDYNDCRDWKHELRIAKEKVLFEGFEVFEDMYHSTKRTFIRNKRKILISVYNKFQYHDGKIEETNPLFINHKIIEDLIKYDLTLTPSAIKKIY